MVPHLITALTGPINELEARVLDSMPAIERWLRLEWMEHTPPFYASVDLRNAGFKLAPVDTDLFPRGFNHLTEEMLPLAVQAAMAAIEKICPEAKNLLIVPQDDDGPFHAEHLERLVRIFTMAGLNVRLGSLDPSLATPRRIALPGGGALAVEPLVRSRRRLGLKDFDPCTILLNHDLAGGTPKLLEGLHEQYLLPPLHAGWVVRRKSRHFQSYEEVAKKFAKLLGMDPWLITPMSGGTVRLAADDRRGLESLKAAADALLARLRRKHKEYGIADKPFVVVKADDGSRGAGVVSLRDAAELDSGGRWAASPLAAGEEVRELLVQEGVATNERINDAVAEPVVCTMDRYVIGGYYRVHAGRRADENLSSPGSTFVPLAFAPSHQLPRPGVAPGASPPNRFYMYGVIGRLAMLAAAYELEATDPEAEHYD
ncbi:MAG: glutamate--cysteine ligase [Pseudomonadota bacterium]|jgi:glutamate--cysteine ligase|nr:glutamate--cysteine ligase [Rubrivivax sp.]MCA3256458.1 glutamate--cysteine ligase [Rubrivivax sp.]MCZ8029292.1 glutamate--cysteine ligase [Rubrivivax sp.]